MKLTGYRRSDFTPKAKTEVIKGIKIFLSAGIDSKLGLGIENEIYFLSDKKIAENNLDLESLLNCDVEVLYNKYGKVFTIRAI